MESQAPQSGQADYTLRIAPVAVELAPDHILSTIGYNNNSPGPVLRMREGKTVTVDVINDTDVPEFVHWHGMLIPPEVDEPRKRARRRFLHAVGAAISLCPASPVLAGTTPTPWPEPISIAEPIPVSSDSSMSTEATIPGAMTRVFLSVRDWEPFFTSGMEDDDDDDRAGPQPEKPAVLDTNPNGLEVNSMTYSINDKALGAGEPIRVKQGQRVLLHLLNASAIENRRIALAGHQFQVIALDGNPVPTPAWSTPSCSARASAWTPSSK